MEKAAGAHIRLESIVLKLARADRVFILIKHNNIITHNISEKKFFFSKGGSTTVIHARDPADPKYTDDDRGDAGYGPPLILFFNEQIL